MRREQLTFFPPFSVALYDRPKGDLTKMPKTGSRREAVLRQIIASRTRGITQDELKTKLPALSREQIIKARLELLEGGFIMDATTRRTTPFGDPAIVWRVSDYGHQMWSKTKRR